MLKFCIKILFCKHYLSPLNTFMRKGKDPDPYLLLMDPDPVGPKYADPDPNAGVLLPRVKDFLDRLPFCHFASMQQGTIYLSTYIYIYRELHVFG